MPRVVDAPAEEESPDEGQLSVDFTSGSLFLKPTEGPVVRLVWDAAAVKSPRSLPAGRYRCVGYRVRKTVDGVDWHLSGAGPSLPVVEVETGSSTHVAFEPAIHLDAKLDTGNRLAFFGSVIQGVNHCGLSVYRDGKRIALNYRLENATGESLAEGKLNYG